jgi:hypothetical protein
MPKSRRAQRLDNNPDFRRRTEVPMPSIEEIERALTDLLSPQDMAPLRAVGARHGLHLRERILNLPVMSALLVSLVWRRMPGLHEALRVLAKEGLMWVGPQRLSVQALSQRLRSLPACVFADLLSCALQRAQIEPTAELGQSFPAWMSRAAARFAGLWVADASTLDTVARHAGELRGQPYQPAGKMMVVVNALTRVPRTVSFSEDSAANEKTFKEQLYASVPEGGLVTFDAGWFSFGIFDELTERQISYVTRMKSNARHESVQVLSESERHRDEIVRMGLYHQNPCTHPARLVSVLWKGQWYRYLTNVLDPARLSAQEVVGLYRRRWRIEEAFLLTKRLLGLAYLWVGDTNGVHLQMLTTWLFYAVLMHLCQQIAELLCLPRDRISEEMVYRGLYHYARALQRDEKRSAARYLADDAKLFGLVKTARKRQSERDDEDTLIWGEALT